MIKLDDIPQKWERNIYLFGGTASKIKKKLEFYKTFKDEYSNNKKIFIQYS